MKKYRIISTILCVCLAAGIMISQIRPTGATPNCTCTISTHSMACPVSGCTCGGIATGVHAESCALAGTELTYAACTCVAAVHAPGCPYYTEPAQPAPAQPAVPEVTPAPAQEPAPAEPTGQDGTDTPAEDTGETTPAEGTDPAADPAADGEGTDSAADGEVTDPASDGEGTDPAADGEGTEPAADGEGTDPDAALTDDADVPAEGEEAEDAEAPDEEAQEEPASEEEKTTEDEPMEAPKVPAVTPANLAYPSGWEGYGAGSICGNVQAAAEFYEMNLRLSEFAEQIAESLGLDADMVSVIEQSDENPGLEAFIERVTVRGEADGVPEEKRFIWQMDNFPDVLAVYAVLTEQTDDYPFEVHLDTAFEKALFESLFWKMNRMSGQSETVYLDRVGADYAAEQLGFTDEEKELLASLRADEAVVEMIIEKSIFHTLSPVEFRELTELIPAEGITPQRRAVLMTAAAIEGKVGYFWGGKSTAYGWDDRWGETRTVTSEGSRTTGLAIPFGLDCSGFVSWTFLNVNSGEDAIAHGTTYQWMDSYDVSWKDALPGDIAFYHPPTGGLNHVGIVLAVDENGPTRIIHCSSGGVQITGVMGFQYIRRPYVYQEREK